MAVLSDFGCTGMFPSVLGNTGGLTTIHYFTRVGAPASSVAASPATGFPVTNATGQLSYPSGQNRLKVD
jgi:hypothetical protein